MRVAMFKSIRFGYEVASSCEYASDTDYVRISEWVDVEFPPISNREVINNQITALDKMAKAVREKAADQLAIIEQKQAELLALPAPDNLGPDDPDPYLCGDEDAGDNATALPSEG